MRCDEIGNVMPDEQRYIVKLSCPDRTGIVAAVSSFFAEHGGWIIEADHHADPVTQKSFIRQEVLANSLPFGVDELRERFAAVAQAFDMEWTIHDTAVKRRVAILVSKQDHCLNDLLYRWRSREMDFDLVGVISNHDDCRSFVAWHDVPYHHVPIDKNNKDAGFQQVDGLIESLQADTIVLARYMQIMPSWICAKYPGRIINIHHSFLPSFVGARPYHQAHARGVKFVGATCHYVTEDLDEGPIIEQDAIRTNHAHGVEAITRVGKDVEKAVLARGLRYHLDDRVILNGKKTVVFG